MQSALTLKLKPTMVPRHAAGGIPGKMKKAAAEGRKRVPKYADGGVQTTQYVSNILPGSEGAYGQLISNAQQLTDPTQTPYTPYQGQRVADVNDLQMQGYGGIANLGPNANSTQAGGIAGLAAQQAMNSSYNPSGFSTYSAPQQVTGPGGPQQVTGPNMSSVAQVSGPGGPQQVGTQSFTQPGAASAYMNPYMQSVVDVQKREATRADDVARTSRNAQAVGAGAFGGSRQAIQEAEANRNLQQHLGDIQTQGSNAAYQQAQAQFNTEQGLGLNAQTANQQAGLATSQMGQQAALANQQAGLQGLSLAQQAALANQKAGLDTTQMGQQAQIANQTAGLNYGNQYLDAQKLAEASKQFGATYGLEGLKTGISGATAQSEIGSDIFKQDYTSATGQAAAGADQRAIAQQGLDAAATEYDRQQQDPYKQLGFMSDILHGTQGAVQNVTGSSTTTVPQASNMQNLIGLGLGLYGATKAKGGSIEGGIAAIAPDNIGDFADGGIVGYAGAGTIEDDPQTAEDRKMYGRWWDTVKDQSARAGAAIADVGTLVPRGLAGAYDTSVVRPMRAAGLPAGYLSGHLMPEGGSPGSMTPFYDRFRTPEEPEAKKGAPTPAQSGAQKLDAASALPEQRESSFSGSGFRMPLVSAGRALTMKELRDQYDAAGPGLAEYTRGQEASNAAVAKAKRDAYDADVKTLEEQHKEQGIAGLAREKKLQGRVDEMGERKERAKGDALMQAGLAILSADPRRGWLAAVGAGGAQGLAQYRSDEKDLRAEKARLDDSMDALYEVRRQEDNAKGKEKAALKSRGNQLEVEAKQAAAATIRESGIAGLKLTDSMFNAFTTEHRDARNRQTQADVANQRASTVNARLNGISRHLIPGTKEYEAALSKEASAVEKSGFLKDAAGNLLIGEPARIAARQHAMRQLANQRQQAEAIAMGETPVDTSSGGGWGNISVREK